MSEVFKEGGPIDQSILKECESWACWKELSELEQEDVYNGYFKIAEAAVCISKDKEVAKLRKALMDIIWSWDNDAGRECYMIAKTALEII